MIHDLWILTRIKIFPVARRNYCHKIKPQVYVHVFTSISVLQNSLSNTTSLTALEILQLLLQLLFNRMIFTETKILVHFYKKKFLDIIIIFHDFPWLSITLAVFDDFLGLENGLTKFDDFPGRAAGHAVFKSRVFSSPVITPLRRSGRMEGWVIGLGWLVGYIPK